MSPKTKSLLMLASTLILGILIGLSAGGPLRRHRAERFMHMPPQKRFVHAMKRILRPSNEQKAAMDKILEGHSAKMTEVREQFESEMFALMDSVQSDLTAILTDEQLTRLNKHLKEGPMGAAADRIQQLAADLDLTEEQVEKVEAIISEMMPMARGEFFTGRRENRAGMRQRMKDTRARIEAILTPGQLQRFKEQRQFRLFPFGRRGMHPGFDRRHHDAQRERE